MPLEDESEIDLKDLAAALGRLPPAPLVNRDRILFRAGQAAGRAEIRGRSLAWRAVAAGLGAVALGEGAWLARRLPPVFVESPVVVHATPANKPAPDPVVPPRPAVVDPTPPQTWPTRGRLAERLALYNRAEVESPAPDRGMTPPTPSSRDLLRRELRAALVEGDRS